MHRPNVAIRIDPTADRVRDVVIIWITRRYSLFGGSLSSVGPARRRLEPPLARTCDAVPRGFSRVLSTGRVACPGEFLHHCAAIAPGNPALARVGRGGLGISPTTMSTVIQTDDRVLAPRTDKRPLVSVVLPAFNEAAILERNLAEVYRYLHTLDASYRWEVI